MKICYMIDFLLYLIDIWNFDMVAGPRMFFHNYLLQTQDAIIFFIYHITLDRINVLSSFGLCT